MASIAIQSYTAEDHAVVCELFVNSMVSAYCTGDDANEGLRKYLNRSLALDVADIEGTYFGPTVAEHGTEVVVGAIAIERKADRRGEVRRLSVRTDYRRKGIARQLIARLESWATDHKF